MLVIADGAAFGPIMEMLTDYQLKYGNSLTLYVPESIEWLILSSGVVPDSEISKILEAPYDYIESSQYFSWERFFTALLVEKTSHTYLQYNKSVLNKAYLQEHEKELISAVLPKGILPVESKNDRE